MNKPPSPFEKLSLSRQWASRSNGKITLRDANLLVAMNEKGERAQVSLPPMGTVTRSKVFDFAVFRLAAKPSFKGKSVAFYVGGLLVECIERGNVVLFTGELLSVGVLRENDANVTA